MLYSSVFFLYLWFQYLNFKSSNPIKKLYHTRRTRILAMLSTGVLLLSLTGWIALSSLTSLCLNYYILLTIIILVLPIVLMAASISLGFSHSERYNKKFVTNHVLYIVLASLFITLCVFTFSNYGLPFGLSDYPVLQGNWHRNISFFYVNVHKIRIAFVLYSVLNAFFIPIFAIFLYYQFNTVFIKAIMIINKWKARNMLSANREHIVDLVHKMLAKEKEEA